MTEVDFYSGGGDRLHTACRLAATAVRKGFKVLIYAPDMAAVEQIDKLLWTFSATDFIPHCQAGDKLAEVTPVTLSDNGRSSPHDDVLLNLSSENPPFFSRFQRVIEIAGNTDEDTRAARKRYRFYQDRGYEIRHHRLRSI
jgi:DNA polymerase III subunit chi